ncbi:MULTISPECIES: hypothetical protein [unclassified Nocardioides]|uniref:hypothetical protein n=1 Tax=unclassified Nocardioides TaxID=2615069 RepID=UPI003014B994
MSTLRSPEPRRRPAATGTAVGLALVVTTLGVLLVTDAVRAATTTQDSILHRAMTDLDGATASTASTAVGVALAAVGLLLLAIGLAPRRRTHLRVESEADVWITPRAAAALAARTAERQPGVLQARVERSGRRRLVIGAVPRTLDDSAALQGAREAAVEELDRLDGPTVEVRRRKST